MALVSPTRTTDTTAQEPLLNHALTTSPDPIKASPENPAEPEVTGELIITLSPKFGPVDVERFKVHVPAGAMASELATNLSAANARISLGGWATRLNDSDEFEFIPTATYETINPGTGITIQISQLPISRKVGTAPITVTERSREGGKGTFHNRATTFNIGKFPADFYMRDFNADPLVINNGGEVTLTWERSTNATYELLYGDTSLNVTNETTRKITNVKSDTTFYLRGTTSSDPNNPATRTLSAQVTVLQPDIEVRNLTVHGTTQLIGDTQTNNLRISAGHTLTADGPTVTNGTFTANGPIDTNETLTAHGLILAKASLAASSDFVVEASGKAVFKGSVGLFNTYAVEKLTVPIGGGSWRSPSHWPDGMALVHNLTDSQLVANVSTGADSYTMYLQSGEKTTFPLARHHTLSLRGQGGIGGDCQVFMIPLGDSEG
ncbi:hypothetical protein AB0O47_19615 [Streptomyces noursei]|uniref:hypothetical protein n=1 Tax=Streptomyces noursei TaxID=1971 RepID=UPI00344F377D